MVLAITNIIIWGSCDAPPYPAIGTWVLYSGTNTWWQSVSELAHSWYDCWFLSLFTTLSHPHPCSHGDLLIKHCGSQPLMVTISGPEVHSVSGFTLGRRSGAAHGVGTPATPLDGLDVFSGLKKFGAAFPESMHEQTKAIPAVWMETNCH